MPRHFTRSRGVFTRPPPRTKMWIGTGTLADTITGSATTLLGSLNAAALALRPFTILRTRMGLWYESDQAAVSERPIGIYTKQVVSDQQVTAGATSVPDALNEPDADFFLVQSVSTSFIFLSSVGFHPQSQRYYEQDVKSMRKVGPNQDIVSVFVQSTASGAVLVTLGRMLIQLH